MVILRLLKSHRKGQISNPTVRVMNLCPIKSHLQQLFVFPPSPPPRMHPYMYLQSVFASEETVCLPSDSQEQHIHNSWQCEWVSAALRDHAVLRGLLYGHRWPAKGSRSW